MCTTNLHYADRYNTHVPSVRPPQTSGHGSPSTATGGFAASVTAITNAFGDPTRRAIYLFVRGVDEGVTAAEVASEFDLHPNVARHHLDKLAAGLKRGSTVSIAGFTSGTQASSLALADARSKATANYLKAKGVKVVIRKSSGGVNGVSLPFSRRVEIQLELNK